MSLIMAITYVHFGIASVELLIVGRTLLFNLDYKELEKVT